MFFFASLFCEIKVSVISVLLQELYTRSAEKRSYSAMVLVFILQKK